MGKSTAIVGIVTDRDLALGLASAEQSARDLPLQRIMSHPVDVISVAASAEDAAEMMLNRHVRRLPIVDGATLVGIVTLDDLVADSAVDPELLAAVVRAQLGEPSRHETGRAGLLVPRRAEGRGLSLRRERREARARQTYDALVRRTQSLAELGARADAEAALEEVIGGILRRIMPDEALHVLSQLPALLRKRLEGLPAGPDRSVSPAEIVRALQHRLNLDAARAYAVSKQVGSVLADSLERGELEDVRAQLPVEMRGLLQ